MILLLWLAFIVSVGGTVEDVDTLHKVHILEECNENGPPISDEEVNGHFEDNENVAQEREALEQKLAKAGRVVKSGCDLNIMRKRSSDPQTHILESKQLPFEAVTETLIRRHDLSQNDIHYRLPRLPLTGESCRKARNGCTVPRAIQQCNVTARFRRFDGTCNNLQNPEWGSAGNCFRRLLPPSYVGQSGFRESVLGGPLPEPRDLSLNIHNNLNRPTNYVNHMYMFFGQLLDHDISQAPISTTVDNQAINCCPPTMDTHPQCAPINIRPNDSFYSQFGTTCMNFVRSALCPTCVLGYRQQMNQITAYIDASFVYGNSKDEARGLRTLTNGKLRSQKSQYGALLPNSPDPSNDQCSFPETNDICFEAGDTRVNQHPPLTSLHTIFMREHNRIADELSKLNPKWKDERVFKETRKIVGAEMQVITYKEYLPITLGDERMRFFNLHMSDRGTTQYDDKKDATLYNEFSGAAFRFGHSLINSIIASSLLNATNQPRYLRNEFFQPFDLRRGDIGPLMGGVVQSPAQWFDRYLVPDVTNYLYRIRGDQAGLDLASINIQRGRDHGLPRYVDMVRFCSDNSIIVRSFDHLKSKKLMTHENMMLLKRNYRDVRDIDLWTGCVSEIYNDDAVVGPTATCIIGLQFNRLKFGDRFYFEHRYQTGSFTYQQLQELRKITLSKIICLNTELQTMPLNAMLFNDRNNPLITCSYARGVDLSYWKD